MKILGRGGEEVGMRAKEIKEEWRREMNEAKLIVDVVRDEGEQHQSHDIQHDFFYEKKRRN